MDSDSPAPFDSLPLSMAQRVDEVCNRFEVVWRTGTRPRIEDYLPAGSLQQQMAFLFELIALEMELRRNGGEDPQQSDYEQRFPDFFARGRRLRQFAATQPVDSPGALEGDHPRDPAFPDLASLAPSYRIHERVESGAMGHVFHATHRSFDMQVAIKVVPQDYSTDRFRREAECLVKVRSPHVVTVHDFQGLPDGSSMLVMEWIEGGTLSDAMNRYAGMLPEHVALPWMRQTCEGMLAVEEQGLVHRDLKPANVMIDRNGKAKVADFGIARDPKHPGQTDTGFLMGTPWYMSPEQADNPRGVDTRSDIYSFGACFYHALTGHPPFNGCSAFQILSNHKVEPLVSPRARNPQITEQTSRLLERCLAKSPDDRFQSFRELLFSFEATPFDQLEERALVRYLARYESRRILYLSRRLANEIPDVYEFPEGRRLSVVVGDLVQQDVEAIVSEDDWLLTMASGVAKVVLRAAGTTIRDELKCTPIRPGRVTVTSGGKLKAQRVFHAVVKGGPPRESISPGSDVVTEILTSCVYHAESFYVSTIAFPLIGTSTETLTEEASLDKMFRFLTSALLQGTTTIRDVRIVISPDANANLKHIPRCHRPALNGYQFFEHFEPARDMAVGDFFEYIQLPGGLLAIVLADVVGHGMAAAELVRQLTQVTRAYLVSDPRVEKAMDHFNQYLCGHKTDRFVTMLVAVLDPATHQLSIANAGQVLPIWRRQDGRVESIGLNQAGLPLGIIQNLHYERFVMTISPGEGITMFNDGTIEAQNADGVRLGVDGVLRQVAIGGSSEDIVKSIVTQVRRMETETCDAICALSFTRVNPDDSGSRGFQPGCLPEGSQHIPFC